MFYAAELTFVQKYLQHCRIQCHIETAATLPGAQLDMGIREMLGLQSPTRKLSDTVGRDVLHNHLYKITNEFFCNYYFLLLPDTPEPTVMIIGPYLSHNIEKSVILELSEKYGLSPQSFPAFERYFSIIPALADDTALQTLLHTFAETIWGGAENFSLEIIEKGTSMNYAATATPPKFPEPDDISFSMQALESRYATENDFLAAVSKGKIHNAELLINNMSNTHMEQRTPDTLRNIKNYTVVMNTLLRKAAEQGSVHPYHIDRISSDYARKIELCTTLEACRKLQKEMVRKYCLLVKNHSMKSYSLLVQKAITRIDSDLTADLSLNAMAQLLSVNPSYLSSQFKKETGSTLTDYVNRKKVEHAILLLNSTPLQIQTIALHCGIPDVNYFTKLFKKYVGKTPKEYRDSIS